MRQRRLKQSLHSHPSPLEFPFPDLFSVLVSNNAARCAQQMHHMFTHTLKIVSLAAGRRTGPWGQSSGVL